MTRPLTGVRVVDLTTSLAGPYCTQILAALGADVVKVERPGGDDARSWGPPFWNGESTTFLAVNAGKRSVVLDLKDEADRGTMRKLLSEADVFVHNLRAGRASALGLGVDEMRELNPRLVYCTIAAFGERGPLHRLPGYDPLMQAAAGIMSVTGEPDGQPVRAGVSIVDQGTALWAVVGVLAALRQRDADGAGRPVDTALYETALNWMALPLVGYLATGVEPRRSGNGIAMIAPYETFPTADGTIMLAAGNDRLYESLRALLDLPDDERFSTNPARAAHQQELAALLRERLVTRTSAEWLSVLREAGIPAAPVHTTGEAARHPQTEALGILQPVPHPVVPDLRLVAPALSIGGERVGLGGPPPALDEHGDDIRANGFAS